MEQRGKFEHVVRTGLAIASVTAATASLAVASAFGKGHEHYNSSVPGVVDCLPQNDPLPPENVYANTPIDQVTSTVMHIHMAVNQDAANAPFAPASETSSITSDPFNIFFNRASQPNKLFYPNSAASRVLKIAGISVVLEPGAKISQGQLQSSQGIEGWAESQLYDIPESIVRASGLKQIIAAPFDGSDNFTQPEYADGGLVLPVDLGVENGLAAMILNNYCSPSSKQRILTDMRSITHAGGVNYNARYHFNYNLTGKAQTKEYNYLTKHIDKYFYDQESVNSPEIEFIDIFSSAIGGGNWYSNQTLKTPAGKKEQLVQAVFDRIMPSGPIWELYGDMVGYWGQCGYTLDQNAARINRLVHALDRAKTTKQKDILLGNEVNQCENHASE